VAAVPEDFVSKAPEQPETPGEAAPLAAPADPPPPPSPLPAASEAAELTSESLWRQSEAILHLARGQAATQALEERLWEITETAASVLSLARASVWTFEDEERTRLLCADFYSAVRDVHESGQAQASRDYPLYFAALHSERPIVAHDAKADPRTRELQGGSLVASQSRIEAPIFVAGRLTGVLRLEHDGSPRRFEHHEERFASSLGDLAGLALEAQERRLKEAVARVGEERVRAQRDALAELSRSEALTRGQLSGVLHEVTEAATRVLRLERTSVWVYAPDYRSLFCLDAFEKAAARHSRGAEIAAERAPVYFDSLLAGGRLSLTDAREEPRLAELVAEGHVPPGIAARLEVPIHLLGRLAGVLWCERAGTPRSWLADEERFAEALAGFVALVIATSERRRNENELRRALDDLDRSATPAAEAEGPPAAPKAAERAPDAFDEDLGDA
jgi:GAF domain-containing protein